MSSTVTLHADACRLRILLGESDKHQGRPLFEWIVLEARRRGMAGATAARGMMGFGAGSRVIHTFKIERLSEDLPVVVELVDDRTKVEAFLDAIEPALEGGLVTLEPVEARSYHSRAAVASAVQVGAVMSRDVASVHTDTPIAQVADLLIRRAVKAVPVLTTEGHVTGMITGGDLIERGGMQLRLSLQQALGDEVITAQIKALSESGKFAADVMTAPVECAHAEMPIAEAARVMAAKRLKRLPVTDADGNLMGIVSRADVLKAMAGLTLVPELAATIPRNGARLVRAVMQPGVPSVGLEATAMEVLERLLGSSLRRVVVVDAEQRPVGVITDGDLLARVTPAARSGLLQVLARSLSFLGANDLGSALDLLKGHTAAEIMSQPVLTMPQDAGLVDAVRLMFERRFKRLPVVDAQGKLVGIVDRQSILNALVQ